MSTIQYFIQTTFSNIRLIVNIEGWRIEKKITPDQLFWLNTSKNNTHTFRFEEASSVFMSSISINKKKSKSPVVIVVPALH